MQSPPPETPPHHAPEFEAIGRGGAGNIVRSRSHSRDPHGEPHRAASRDRIAKVWQKITHQQPHDIAEEPAGDAKVVNLE